MRVRPRELRALLPTGTLQNMLQIISYRSVIVFRRANIDVAIPCDRPPSVSYGISMHTPQNASTCRCVLLHHHPSSNACAHLRCRNWDASPPSSQSIFNIRNFANVCTNIAHTKRKSYCVNMPERTRSANKRPRRRWQSWNKTRKTERNKKIKKKRRPIGRE